jgi:hypothetical protein
VGKVHAIRPLDGEASLMKNSSKGVAFEDLSKDADEDQGFTKNYFEDLVDAHTRDTDGMLLDN